MNRPSALRWQIVSLALMIGSLPVVVRAQTIPKYRITSFVGFAASTNSSEAINDKGEIAGTCGPNNDACIYHNGKLTDLGGLPNATSSSGIAINNAGEVAGTSALFIPRVFNGSHAFLESSGTFTDLGSLDPLGSSFSKGINDSGEVTGIATLGFGGPEHAFLSAGGSMIDLGTLPHGNFSQGLAINSSGLVTGLSDTTVTVNGVPNAAHTEHAFLSSGGAMIDLGTLPGDFSSAGAAINAQGDVAGTSGSHAFLYKGGGMIDLGSLPGGVSVGLGLNNKDQVVGFSGPPALEHAFLYSNGTMVDLNSRLINGAGWNLGEATAINDNGQILGFGTFNGLAQDFLLTPASVPEGSTLLVLGFCLGAGAICQKRRRRV